MIFRFLNTNEPVTTFYRDLVPALLAEGHEVEIYMSSAQYREKRGFEELFNGTPGVSTHKLYSGPLKNYKGFVSKGLAHLLFAIHGFFRMCFTRKVDVNVYLTQPPFYYLTGKIIRYLKGTDYFVVVMDLQPDEYVEFGLMKRDGFLTNFLAKKTANSFKSAKGIIVIGRCMANVVESKGVSKKNIHFIPNWTTETTIRPVPIAENKLRDSMGWQEKFVIIYGGNIGNAQFFGDFVDLAAEMSDQPDIIFCLIGGGMRFDKIAEEKKSRKITNLEMLPFMHDKYSLAEIYGAGNANFISLRPDCTGLGVPSKAYVSLAAGRPIIFQGSAESEIARLVSEENIGLAVQTKENLKAAILKLHNNPTLCDEYGAKARQLSDTKYSTASSCKKYVDLLSTNETLDLA